MIELAGISTGYSGIHIDIACLDDCKNLAESYGEICIHCNKCGRFDDNQKEGERSD